MSDTPKTVVIYHGNCPDGVGGAYAAWKKFGDDAKYIPAEHGRPVPMGLSGNNVYFIDFSYKKDILQIIEKSVARLVVLDHHLGAQEAVESVSEHVFDLERSGTGIAWEYFHPGVPLPRFLAYVQENDLWKDRLPHTREVGAFLGTQELSFASYEKLEALFADDASFADVVAKGSAFAAYRDHLCETIAESASLVQFGEHQILAVEAPSLLKSKVGHLLAHKHGAFGLVLRLEDGVWHCSLRGDGSVDVSAIARTHGGNGHHDAASFRVPFGQPLPFTLVQQ